MPIPGTNEGRGCLPVAISNIGKSKVEAVSSVGALAFAKNVPGVSLARTFSGTQINTQPAIHGQSKAAVAEGA
eukprot:2337299-Pleurochrysis_carterae.AAC.1